MPKKVKSCVLGSLSIQPSRFSRRMTSMLSLKSCDLEDPAGEWAKVMSIMSLSDLEGNSSICTKESALYFVLRESPVAEAHSKPLDGKQFLPHPNSFLNQPRCHFLNVSTCTDVYRRVSTVLPSYQGCVASLFVPYTMRSAAFCNACQLELDFASEVQCIALCSYIYI